LKVHNVLNDTDLRLAIKTEVIIMIQLAICDDDEEIVMFQKEVIQNVLRSCKSVFAITTYTHGHNLLYDIIEDGFFYDLLLLDIEMPEVTGMEIAEKIKPYLS
jgi:CheY-like chemotaxis protein